MTLTLQQQKYLYETAGVDLFKRISSPIRPDDTDPSFSTTEYEGVIRWKDFGNGKKGDVFTLYMELLNINFPAAKKKIEEVLDGADFTKVEQTFQPPIPKDMKVVAYGEFRKFELEYWAGRDTTKQALLDDQVYPLKLLMVNNSIIGTSTPANPRFIYFLNEERTAWKVYSPLDKNNKWTSCNLSEVMLESPLQYNHKDLILFTSKKDKLVFNTVTDRFDTNSLLSEGNFSKLLKNKEVLNYYDNVYYFRDMDERGEDYAAQICAGGNNIKEIKINTNLLNYFASNNVKDVDDIRVKLGREEFVKIINQILKENNL